MYSFILLFGLVGLSAARTDLTGCTSSDVIAYGGASVLWYVPGTGEICDFLDCGGGRAPIKTTVPGCPEYSGTATYSPSYISGFNGDAAAATPASSTAYVAAATTAAASTTPFTAQITGSQTTTDGDASLPTSIAPSDVTVLSGSVSSTIGTSSGILTDSSAEPQSSRDATGSISASISSSSSSSTSSPSSSSTTSGAVVSSSDSSNAGLAKPINFVAGGLGAMAAAFTFFL